jgi:amino acid permease
MNLMTFSAIATATVFYTACSTFPFMTFGRGVEQNFLTNYDSGSGWVQAVRVAAAFQVCVGYVLVTHPLRNSLIGISQRLNLKLNERSEVFQRYLATALVIALTLGTSLLVGDRLGLVINLSGLIGDTTMCFVIPSYLYCLSRKRVDYPISWTVSAAFVAISVVLYPVVIFDAIYD